MKNIIPVTQARKDIFSLVEDIDRKGSHYLLTEKGRAKVVMMSADEFESWQETLEVMREFPDLDKDIKEAKEAFKKGEFVTLDELLKEEGYEIPSRNSRKSRKKT